MGAPVVMLPALRAGESWRVKRKCMTKGERESPREPWVKEGQEGGDRGSDRGALGQELDAMRPVKLVMLMGGSCHLAASCHPAGRVAWLGCRTRRMLGAPTLSPPSCWSRGAWTVGALVDRRPRRSVGLLGLGGMKGSRPPRCPERVLAAGVVGKRKTGAWSIEGSCCPRPPFFQGDLQPTAPRPEG